MNEPPALPLEGFVRLRQIIGPNGPLPVGRSSFYAGIKAGLWPTPKKIGAMSLWSVAELRACLNRLEQSTVVAEPAQPSKPSPPT